MTIKEQLLLDKTQNKITAIAIAKKVCSSLELFDELMACFHSNEYRLTQRAAWIVRHAVNIQPQLIYPYLKDLAAQLLRTDVHDAVIRNSTRILLKITIPEEYHGEVMNACFILAEKPETAIAIKAFSLSMLYKLSLLYPDIKQELEALADLYLDDESAAVKGVAKKIITSFGKAKSPGINHKSHKISNHR